MRSDVSVDGAIKALERFERGMRFAGAVALTRTGKAVIAAEQHEMRDSFDRPTPYTLNSLKLTPATPDRLEAMVAPKDGNGGTPAWKYLAPAILGGARRMKRFEVRLGRGGVSDNAFVVPGRGATLDAYGNLSRGQITQVLSRLRLLDAFGANVSAKTIRRLGKRKLLVNRGNHVQLSDYFVARQHGNPNGRPIAVYRLLSKGKVVPVLVFTNRAPSYEVAFDYFYAAELAAGQAFDQELSRAIGQYLR